jgi:formylglycine-generating enzyme required for sulfatase activity
MSLPSISSTRFLLEPQLARISEGWFWMGSEAGQDHAGQDHVGQDNERPLHRVWVDEFQLACCTVTNAAYAHFARATGNPPAPFCGNPDFNHPEQPVVAVSWFDAVKYCEWLSLSTGQSYRLPTEAEWERAARGGVESQLYPWGDAPPQSLPDYEKRWKKGPEPVAQYAPNAFGLYDICENVHEWCSDWYQASYYAVSPARNPAGPDQGDRRASRGGSWRHHIKASRCAARSSIPPEFHYADYGFRVACSAGVPPAVVRASCPRPTSS